MTKVQFPEFLEDLRQRPIPIDPWRAQQVGPRNDGPYKEGYQGMVVRDAGDEVLVDISTLGLLGGDFYLEKFFAGDDAFWPLVKARKLQARAFLRSTHARRLARVDRLLRRHDLFLFIRSAWRHPEVQALAKARLGETFGTDIAHRMCSSTGSGMAPPPHSTGAAFDLEIRSLASGQSLPMRARVRGAMVFGSYRLEEIYYRLDAAGRGAELEETLRNRRLLYHLLATPGVVFDTAAEVFVAHPGEFWHFGDGDPLSSYLAREEYARYGVIFPERPDADG